MKPEGSVIAFIPPCTASLLSPEHAFKTQAMAVLPGRLWKPVARACQSFVRADIPQVTKGLIAPKFQKDRIYTLALLLPLVFRPTELSQVTF